MNMRDLLYRISMEVFIVKPFSISNLNPDFSNNEMVKFPVNLIKA